MRNVPVRVCAKCELTDFLFAEPGKVLPKDRLSSGKQVIVNAIRVSELESSAPAVLGSLRIFPLQRQTVVFDQNSSLHLARAFTVVL